MAHPFHSVIMVPTYQGSTPEHNVDPENFPEFTAADTPVTIYPGDGVIVALGTDKPDDGDQPCVIFERRRNGWMIVLTPIGGSDASGYVYFLDDGRSFIAPERGATPSIELINGRYEIPELDELPETAHEV